MGDIDRLKVDILIPAYNEEKYLGLCLKYLKKQRLLNDIIVIDDFSTDSTAEIAKKYNAPVIKPEKPIDQRDTLRAENLNYGLRFISTKYFIRVDADCILLKDYIYNCVKYITKKKRVYSVSGILPPIYPNWAKLMGFFYQIYPRGGGRLYNTEILKKIGGFHADPKPRKYGRRGIFTRFFDDITTDKVAAQLNYFKGISRKAKAWHLRPIMKHFKLDDPNRYEKMFFLLLYFKFREFCNGIKLIKDKIQRFTLKKLLSIVKIELKSLIIRLSFRIIESEEKRFWLKSHLRTDFSDIRF